MDLIKRACMRVPGVRSVAEKLHRLSSQDERVRSDLGTILVQLAALENRLDAIESAGRAPTGGTPNGVDAALLPASRAEPSPLLTSCLCTQRQVESAMFTRWCAEMRERPYRHRKLWEWAFVCQALFQRRMLEPGKEGLGFGVGEEPLPALFARYGCRIRATELALASTASSACTSLNRAGICPEADFERLVTCEPVDMRSIPDSLTGFDFVWSSCALEHLGSLELAGRFVLHSLRCLKPGGLAVHTTEFNLSSNDRTLDSGTTVLLRRRDLEDLVAALEAEGHEVAPLDLQPGDGLLDRCVDTPPYRREPHLTLELAGYLMTSVGLIIRKGAR